LKDKEFSDRPKKFEELQAFLNENSNSWRINWN